MTTFLVIFGRDGKQARFLAEGTREVRALTKRAVGAGMELLSVLEFEPVMSVVPSTLEVRLESIESRLSAIEAVRSV